MTAEARAKLAERRLRVRRIRRRVLATSLTTFAVAWAVIFFQLVAGRDPGLAHSTKAVATTSQSTQKQKSSTKKKASSSGSTTSSTDTSGSIGSSTSTGSSSSTGSSTSSSSPSAVTTSQS